MLMDTLTQFCDGVALNTGAAGTYLIGDQIDLQDVRDIGTGTPLYLVIQCDVAAASGGTSSAQFKLVSDSSAAIATDGTATEHIVTHAFNKNNDLIAGKTLATVVLPFENHAATYERYLGILQTTVGNAFTAGSVSIFLTDNPPSQKSYPDGVN